MAGVQLKKGHWYLNFRFHGERYFVGLGKLTQEQAQAKIPKADKILELIDQGFLTVPPGYSLAQFVVDGGKVKELPSRPDKVRLKDLTEAYLKVHGNGTLAPRT